MKLVVKHAGNWEWGTEYFLLFYSALHRMITVPVVPSDTTYEVNIVAT